MKKLILTIALVLAGATTFATTIQTTNQETVINQDYKEITVESLPDAVKEAVKKDHANATIQKAYINDKKEYKLELTVEGATKTVYADEKGNWLNK